MFSAPKLVIVIAVIFFLFVLPSITAIAVYAMRKESKDG